MSRPTKSEIAQDNPMQQPAPTVSSPRRVPWHVRARLWHGVLALRTATVSP